ncbi:hypothetical protein MMC06_004496 [Schaereria dolodes]|nr:hypothetical protein [Schaereria dolodes]
MANEIVAAWHSYRIPAFVLVLFVLVVIRIIRKASGSEKLLPPPIARSKILQATIFEEPKLPELGTPKEDEVDLGFQRSLALQSRLRVEKKIAVAKARVAPRRVTGWKTRKLSNARGPLVLADPLVQDIEIQPLVFFMSLTGSTKSFAERLVDDWKSSLDKDSSRILAPQLHDLSYIDFDDFVTPPKAADSNRCTKFFYLLLIPTYNIDTILSNFLEHLRDTHHDFRIDTAPISSLLGYSVFGFGDKGGWKTESEGFCSQAREVDKWMAKLTDCKRAFPLGMGDVKSDVTYRLEEWRLGVEDALQGIIAHGSLGDGVQGSGDPVESDEDDFDEAENGMSRRGVDDPTGRTKGSLGKGSKLDDLEDLGGKVPDLPSNAASPKASSSPLAVDFTSYNKALETASPLKEMVPLSSPTYHALTKQGYSIIGSHSGVKICRWTKSALRGRGSCYKYSFYGIKSHLCMETTPSLSCSNKCVFCWRHGTNPVGTTWRWKVDPPEMIFEGAKAAHLKKIKMMRGVPGVRAERFQEAMRIRHCALSLVGEPIFYPHINDFVGLLHNERISSFLVCNAQHPEQLEALKVVTQLYVSIDASNRDSLRKIDRPLHRDFWERFQRCLDILREKRFRMRTVFRLTLVKNFNVEDEVEGYADLVAKGLPCFVEVKGVTYCGTASSAGAGLTMQNVPFYEEVAAFAVALTEALDRRGLGYGIGAEHAHSCCVLIASKRFFVEGKWHTLIDYEKFFACLDSGKDFAPEDYMGSPTPEWASWGHGGFDPADERVYRKGKNKITASVEEVQT